MEQFRVKVEKRLKWMKVLVALFLLVLLATRLIDDLPCGALLSGACTGGGLMALVTLFQQSQCLKDEKKLRQLWITENDERMKAIRAKAGEPFVIVMSLGLLLAALVAGFFSETVADTLVMVAVAQLLISIAVKMVCSSRM